MMASCPVYGTSLDMSHPPRRVVSFVSSATETLFALGCGDAVAGVTPSCARYVEGLGAAVVGDYLKADVPRLRALDPDLVLVTQGVQSAFGRRLAEEGFPVWALPLPASRWAILANQLTLGGVMHQVAAARTLNVRMEAGFEALMGMAPARRPKVFVELWFGRHPRTIEGLTFIHDLVELAGGTALFGHASGAYPMVDLEKVNRGKPDVWLLFQEPEHPVDGEALAAQRGWTIPRIDAGVACGRNPIHDGPSFLDTAFWLREHFQRIGRQP